MKKYLSASLALILITFGLPTNSYAATDGCPQNWVIDTSQYPNSELESAKVTLGRNIVVTELTEYSPKDNSWVNLPTYSSQHFQWINELPQRKIVKVEVKDCPSRSFIFPIQTALATQLQDMSAQEWAEKNPARFRNFKVAEEWVASISEYKNYIIKVSQSFDKKTNSPKIIGLRGGELPGYTLLIFNQECGIELRSPSVGILKLGTTCKLGIATGNTIFERFEIQNGSLNSSIVCIKGKLNKKISGINPKCPKGYKVKV